MRWRLASEAEYVNVDGETVKTVVLDDSVLRERESERDEEDRVRVDTSDNVTNR